MKAQPLGRTFALVGIIFVGLIIVLALGPDFLVRHDAVITALATVVIAAFTIVLAWATAAQAEATREALEATRLAANAAMLQARAAVGMELPILRAPPIDDLVQLTEPMPANGAFGGGVNDFAPTKHSAVGPFSFRNMGRTPAFPVKLEVGWCACATLPELPEYKASAKLPHAAVVAPNNGEPWRPEFYMGIELSDAEIAAVADGSAWLWLYGCLTYSDFLGEQN